LSDTSKRTLTKAFTWKIFTFLSLAVGGLITTGSIKKAITLSLIYQLYTFIMFNIHERIWNMFSWGKRKGMFIQMTGLSGAGKSTIANEVKRRLEKRGIKVEVIDGDEYRQGLCNDLGFSKEDRNTNIRRLGFVAKVLARNNVVTIMSAINPYEDVRKELRDMSEHTKTVFVKCDIETLKQRDPKDLYRRALLPDGHAEKINNFTGISDPFDVPLVCNLTIDTSKESLEESATKLEKFILKNT